MALNNLQKNKLIFEINNNSYKKIAYNFDGEQEINFRNYLDLEKYIQNQLLSDRLVEVKNGLSNVLYWGYASSPGRQKYRVNRFRECASETEMRAFVKLVDEKNWTLLNLMHCRLPQFSRISFISKIFMFINPSKYVTLDLQLAKIKTSQTATIFRNLIVYKTSIPITLKNEEFYVEWCQLCENIAKTQFAERGYRAVDIERGIFSLVRNGEVGFAAECLANA